MELLERELELTLLQQCFDALATGEGNCAFVYGDAGMGKSSLVRQFCRQLTPRHRLLTGSCDALFSPRPLGPVYDILYQMGADDWQNQTGPEQRVLLFNHVFNELAAIPQPIVLWFEDIHWADEATLDFIRFLARRISRLSCMFILTFRDNEIAIGHPLRQVMSQIPPASIQRIALQPLSRATVDTLSKAKAYDGARVFGITGGNPFYVNEILAAHHEEIPRTLSDTVLAVFQRQSAPTRGLWELLSVLPSGFEPALLEQIDAGFDASILNGLQSGILVEEGGYLKFKHELYRLAIEAALPSTHRVRLNQKILDLFAEIFLQAGQVERVVHHATQAGNASLTLNYAPQAARKAAGLGAHTEAARLYVTAIEYSRGADMLTRIQFFEAYAYECYLTSQLPLAIEYTEKAKQLWEEAGNAEQTGNSMRFLSRLWWFSGNGANALLLAEQAIQQLKDIPAGRVRALAYSNMSQLKMLAGETDACIYWGEQAIGIANALADPEILSHAKNNIGSVLMKQSDTFEKGLAILEESLQIAIQHSFHEHVARAYTNLSSGLMQKKRYRLADRYLTDGLKFCEERDLDSWTIYMSYWKAQLKLETGFWDEAFQLATYLINHPKISVISLVGTISIQAVIQLRRGSMVNWEQLEKARQQAFATGEVQRIVPVMLVFLEGEWITGERRYKEEDLETANKIINASGAQQECHEYSCWLWLARRIQIPFTYSEEGYELTSTESAAKSADYWAKCGAPYYEAVCSFFAGQEEALKAVEIMGKLGATAVQEKMKKELRAAGIKKIPRGIQKKTASNSAGLTARELEILKHIQDGLQNKEIAAKLFLSAKTIDNHITSILFKLDVNSRVKAVQRAKALSIL